MTPVEYCYQKAAIPGSALYFSTRHLDPLMRDAIVTICAFYKEIEDATLLCAEPAVTQKKLTWWRKQMTNMSGNRVDHPIAIMLQTLMPSFTLNPQHFISMIDGLEQNLCRPRHSTFEDVVVHIMRTAGTREFLIATLLLKNESVPQETIYQFALVLELVNHLQHVRKYARSGLYLFSDSELDQFNVSDRDFQSHTTTMGLRQLFQSQSEKIERAYQKALEGLSQEQKNEIGNIIIRSDIACSVLNKIQSKQYKILEENIEITPLRCWWVSWRAAARYSN